MGPLACLTDKWWEFGKKYSHTTPHGKFIVISLKIPFVLKKTFILK
jgi:hypothetical protein